MASRLSTKTLLSSTNLRRTRTAGSLRQLITRRATSGYRRIRRRSRSEISGSNRSRSHEPQLTWTALRLGKHLTALGASASEEQNTAVTPSAEGGEQLWKSQAFSTSRRD